MILQHYLVGIRLHQIKICIIILSACTLSLTLVGMFYTVNNVGLTRPQCRLITLDDLHIAPRQPEKVLKNLSFGAGLIPKIVHYTYATRWIPVEYAELAKRCVELNPSYLFVYWTDDAALRIMAQLSTKHYNILKNYYGLERANILRYMLLYHFGGIYLDLDMECRVSFSSVFLEMVQRNPRLPVHLYSAMVDQTNPWDAQIWHNKAEMPAGNFMMAAPKHKFLEHMVDNLKFAYGSTIQMRTGSFMLHTQMQSYLRAQVSRVSGKTFQGFVSTAVMKKMPQSFHINAVLMANADWFSPLVANLTRTEEKCRYRRHSRRPSACRIFSSYKTESVQLEQNALLIHRQIRLPKTLQTVDVFRWPSLKMLHC